MLAYGDIVKSIAGRDKNLPFLVVKVEEKFAYISDGRKRKINALKKKSVKHLELILKGGAIDIAERIKNGESVSGDLLYKAVTTAQNLKREE